ncbi:MAG: TolC family protein [Rikenellaceae bacterium]
MKHYIKILLFALATSVGVAYGQSGRELSIEECREMAIESNYNLKSSVEKVMLSEDLVAAYRANYFHDFSVRGGYLYSTTSFSQSITGGYLPIFVNGVMDSSSFAYMPDQEYELEVGSLFGASAVMTQPIYTGGKISSAVKLAKLGVEVSNLEKLQSEAEVLERVDNAFYQLIELEEVLKSAERYQAVVEEFYRVSHKGMQEGMINRNDVMKVTVRLNEAKLLTQRARNGVNLSRMNLCYLIGLPITTSQITPIDPLVQGLMVTDMSLDVTARPEYTMLEKQIEAKELDMKITRSDFLPSVSAIASYGYTNGVTLNDTKLLNSGSFTGGVILSIPIFHWGEGRRKVSAKQHDINIANNQMKDLTQQMQLELMQAINNYNESLLEVELTKQAVAQAEENMRLSRNHYDVGMESIADYLESQAIWQKAMSDMCGAKRKERTAYTRLLKCRGELYIP